MKPFTGLFFAFLGVFLWNSFRAWFGFIEADLFREAIAFGLLLPCGVLLELTMRWASRHLPRLGIFGFGEPLLNPEEDLIEVAVEFGSGESGQCFGALAFRGNRVLLETQRFRASLDKSDVAMDDLLNNLSLRIPLPDQTLEVALSDSIKGKKRLLRELRARFGEQGPILAT